MEFLSPVTDKEKKVLSEFPEKKTTSRLSCQMKVEKAGGLVRLKY